MRCEPQILHKHQSFCKYLLNKQAHVDSTVFVYISSAWTFVLVCVSGTQNKSSSVSENLYSSAQSKYLCTKSEWAIKTSPLFPMFALTQKPKDPNFYRPWKRFHLQLPYAVSLPTSLMPNSSPFGSIIFIWPPVRQRLDLNKSKWIWASAALKDINMEAE